MAHTEGEWIAKDFDVIAWCEDFESVLVATTEIDDPCAEILNSLQLGNTKLIAAAPDLLSVAKDLMSAHRGQLPSETADLYGGGCGCPLCEQARAAIAKAEGEV